MTSRRWLVVSALIVGLAALGAGSRFLGQPPTSPMLAPALNPFFVVMPYWQLGDSPADAGRLDLLWLGKDRDESWSVEVKTAPGRDWAAAGPAGMRRIAVEEAEPHRLYRATVSGLTAGEEFEYRLRRDGEHAYGGTARARRPPGRAHRFVAFGDCGAGTPEQKAVAHQAWLAKPDYVLIPGDIVYTKGRVSEYLKHFFPIYNHDVASPEAGAPLMRSVPFVAAPGNHDLVWRDLDQTPDALAYFYYWSQPLNGPDAVSDPTLPPALKGSEGRRRAFLDRAGAAYPRMANFSFDYAGAHWAVLDANTYADLTGAALRDWLARDLAAAAGADWRFVALHHPPFHSSKAHADDQRTRLLAGLFERGKVDMVICGHVHNYQRSQPLKFVAEGASADGLGHVGGRWALDRAYDGQTRTTPDGIIYLVTGAGGARLYDSRQHGDSASWREYTARFISDVHSLTVVDVERRKLTVRQVSGEGKELDRFVVTRRQDGTMGPPRPTDPAEGGH